jgi:hypothetical protein
MGLRSKKNSTIKNDQPNQHLGSYLAGLIEGNGTIRISKLRKDIAMIKIVFNSKDLPLAERLLNL